MIKELRVTKDALIFKDGTGWHIYNPLPHNILQKCAEDLTSVKEITEEQMERLKEKFGVK